MATHLMLSLKKAAAEPMGSWSVATMTDVNTGTLHFTPQMLGAQREASTLSNEGDMELESVPSLLRNRGSQQQLR
jgi:hypothetical protein